MNASNPHSQVNFNSEVPRPMAPSTTPSIEWFRNMNADSVQTSVEFPERRTQAVDHSGLWDV